jgi:hypothetical protein
MTLAIALSPLWLDFADRSGLPNSNICEDWVSNNPAKYLILFL